MSRLNKFLHLSFSEKTLLVRIWVLLAITRLGLSLLPFTTLRKVLTVTSPLIARGGEALSEDLLVWAVGHASRYVPRATCLAQALAIQLVLKQSGRQASLHIGVNGVEGDHLDAHAWVVIQGRVLFGGSNLSRYTHLVALE
jgi:hypothetical protein